MNMINALFHEDLEEEIYIDLSLGMKVKLSSSKNPYMDFDSHLDLVLKIKQW